MSSQRDFARENPRGGSGTRTRRSISAVGSVPRGPSRLRRWVRGGLALFVFGIVCAVIGYWALIFYYQHQLPQIVSVEDYRKMARELTRIVSDDGAVLAELGEERRSLVDPSDIPKHVKDAVLAAEDADFYQHGGLDYFGMARAMYRNIRNVRIKEGASTITQQVAKTLFLSSERTVSRKLKEVVLAHELESKLSKDEILYLYLNQIYWGHGRYGIKEAARHYFGKSLKELTIADAALLAGLLPAPERFSPFNSEQKARERRAFVLDQMAQHGFLARELTDAAKREPMRLNLTPDPNLGIGAYAAAMAEREVIEILGAERVKQGGLRIVTTIDVRMQREAERMVRSELAKIDTQFGWAAPLEQLPPSRIPDRIAVMRDAVRGRGIRSGEIVTGVVTAVDAAHKSYSVHVGLGLGRLSFASLSRYRGGRSPEAVFAVGDVLRVSPRLPLTGEWPDDARLPQLTAELGPQAALVAIDPATRAIKALVGGYDYETHPFNRASMSRRQAGSTIKPFVYGAALEAGVITPSTRFDNVPESYPTGGGKWWTPKNYSGGYDGKSYSARLSLAKSINVVAVKVLEKVGVARFQEFLKRVGVSAQVARDLSVALGSTGVSAIELCNAYATLAAAGEFAEPVLVSRVEDSRGNVLYEASRAPRRGTTAEVASWLTEMMQAVVTHGTAKSLISLGRPIAGKTGTTDKGIDTWFVGYVPQLVTAVWVGFDDMRAVDKASGGTIAAPLWGRFMAASLETTPPRAFARPEGVGALGPVEEPTAGTTVNAADLPAQPVPCEGPDCAPPAPSTELLYE